MSQIAIERPDEKTAVLTLAGEITVQCARTLYDALLAAVGENRSLAVRAGGVTRMDAAALQVLLAAARAASSSHLAESGPGWERAFARYAVDDPFRRYGAN